MIRREATVNQTLIGRELRLPNRTFPPSSSDHTRSASLDGVHDAATPAMLVFSKDFPEVSLVDLCPPPAFSSPEGGPNNRSEEYFRYPHCRGLAGHARHRYSGGIWYQERSKNEAFYWYVTSSGRLYNGVICPRVPCFIVNFG